MPEDPNASEAFPTTRERLAKRHFLNKIFLAIIGVALLAGIGGVVNHFRRFANAMNKENCAANLRQIANGLFMYANEYGGVYPPDLATMAANEDITGIPFFCVSDCPEALRDASGTVLASALRNGPSAFVYIGAGVRVDAGERVMIAYEKPSGNHEGRNVAYADGHVDWFSNEQFGELMSHPTTRATSGPAGK